MAFIFCAWFSAAQKIEKHSKTQGAFLESGFGHGALYWNQPEQDEKPS